MKTIKRFYTILIFAVLLLIVGPTKALAASASFSYSGDSTIQQGATATYKLNISPSEAAYGFQGTITYDSSYLQLTNISGTTGQTCSFSGTKFVCYDGTMGSHTVSGGSVISITFKALKVGSTSLGLSGAKVGFGDKSNAQAGCNNFGIYIKEPPSTNSALKSLSVSNCSISFSAGNYNYSCSVDSSVTSTSISAAAADGGASVSGTGNKSLNYGNNKFSITVKAPAGNTSTYTVTINRKDNRSTDNTLASLTCSNCTLSPAFSSGTTSYKTSVEYAVSSLKLNATAKDSKSKVKINNNSLVAEETVTVSIVVTAENGSTKTYTIAASRGKDPNKVLNTDNNLTSLTVDQGILSPAFSADVTSYIVYLPYEITGINIGYQVSDTRYGVATFDGPDSLGVGNNIYTISVKAEDESVKTYTVTVVRAKVLNGESSNNALLASLKMKNGTLTEKFESGVHLYYYDKESKKDISLIGVAQDEEAVVTYLSAGSGVYAVLVTAQSGNMSIYICLPSEMAGWVYALIAAIAVLLVVIIILIIKKIITHKKNNPISKEEKKLFKQEQKHLKEIKKQNKKDKKKSKKSKKIDIDEDIDN